MAARPRLAARRPARPRCARRSRHRRRRRPRAPRPRAPPGCGRAWRVASALPTAGPVPTGHQRAHFVRPACQACTDVLVGLRDRGNGRRGRRRYGTLGRGDGSVTGGSGLGAESTSGATVPPPAPSPAGLGGLVRRGLALSFLNTLVGRAGTVLVGIVLARLLAPEDFGVFAVALVALTAVLSMNELGVSLALVRWPGDPRRIAPTVMTISLVSSGVLYLGCLLAAGPFATAMGAPQAAGVVRLLCLSVLLDGLTATPAQLLTRDFEQGKRMVVDQVSFALSTGVTIWLAVAGHGAWSLAWGRLVGNVLSVLLLFRFAALWPRPGWDRRHAGELLRFGLPLAGASLLVFAMLNAGYVVVGPLLGTVALGFYLQAFNLSSWPVNVFSTSVRRVSLAAFSRLQDHPAALLAAATLPVCALLGLLATPLVSVVYGQRWAPAAQALQFLAVLGLIRVVVELLYDFLVAAGRSRQTMLLQGLWLALLVPALVVGAHLDALRGAALAQAAVAAGVVLPLYARAAV